MQGEGGTQQGRHDDGVVLTSLRPGIVHQILQDVRELSLAMTEDAGHGTQQLVGGGVVVVEQEGTHFPNASSSRRRLH